MLCYRVLLLYDKSTCVGYQIYQYFMDGLKIIKKQKNTLARFDLSIDGRG